MQFVIDGQFEKREIAKVICAFRIVLTCFGLSGRFCPAMRVVLDRGEHYNTKRPHSALGDRQPDPETIVPVEPRPIMHSPSTWITQVGLIRVAMKNAGIHTASRTVHRMCCSDPLKAPD